MEENVIDDLNKEYDKLKWFKHGWYRKFKNTEFIKSSSLFDRVFFRSIVAKERFCDKFGYDEDDNRPDEEFL